MTFLAIFFFSFTPCKPINNWQNKKYTMAMYTSIQNWTLKYQHLDNHSRDATPFFCENESLHCATLCVTFCLSIDRSILNDTVVPSPHRHNALSILWHWRCSRRTDGRQCQFSLVTFHLSSRPYYKALILAQGTPSTWLDTPKSLHIQFSADRLSKENRYRVIFNSCRKIFAYCSKILSPGEVTF